MTQAVGKNEFPKGSQLAEEGTKKVFAEIINREKTYGKERSKIVLIDFFHDTNAPVTIEAVAQRYSVKKVFLEILQNLQENT